MNVNQIIKSLKEEPGRWKVDGNYIDHSKWYIDTIDYSILVKNDNTSTFYYLLGWKYIYGINRLRLRWAIWRWKRKHLH